MRPAQIAHGSAVARRPAIVDSSRAIPVSPVSRSPFRRSPFLPSPFSLLPTPCTVAPSCGIPAKLAIAFGILRHIPACTGTGEIRRQLRPTSAFLALRDRYFLKALELNPVTATYLRRRRLRPVAREDQQSASRLPAAGAG